MSDQARTKAVDKIVDATGYRCPMPVILMEKALRDLGRGARLQITADDPVASVDIPHFAHAGGHAVERLPGPSGFCVFLVTAGGNPPPGEGAEPPTARPRGRHFLSEGGKG